MLVAFVVLSSFGVNGYNFCIVDRTRGRPSRTVPYWLTLAPVPGFRPGTVSHLGCARGAGGAVCDPACGARAYGSVAGKTELDIISHNAFQYNCLTIFVPCTCGRPSLNTACLKRLFLRAYRHVVADFMRLALLRPARFRAGSRRDLVLCGDFFLVSSASHSDGRLRGVPFFTVIGDRQVLPDPVAIRRRPGRRGHGMPPAC
jgi:hypothetical protein